MGESRSDATRKPPLAVDIDGTLTREDATLDPRVLDVLREYSDDGTVVLTTGKVLPNATALCDFAGIEHNCVAETGGITLVEGELSVNGDGEAARRAVEEFVETGHSKGFGEEGADLVNRWRETEVAVRRDAPLDELRKFAEGNGVTVVDTGYAYHVKSPGVDKGKGLRTVAEGLGLEAESFVAVGDSENDVATFEVVGKSFAVANADDEAKEAADEVTDESYADGFLEAVSEVRS